MIHITCTQYTIENTIIGLKKKTKKGTRKEKKNICGDIDF